MSDTLDKLSGKAKEWAGKVTHNRDLQAKGKIQAGMATMRQRAKDTVQELDDSF